MKRLFESHMSKKQATSEIISCCKFVIQQIKKGYTGEEVSLQAQGHYGWRIAEEARKAFERKLA